MKIQTLFLTVSWCSLFLSACGPREISECFVSENIEVYADLNRNGQRDGDEPPLEGIEVRIFERESGRQVGDSFKTDVKGGATVGFISRGDCNPENYEINLRIVLNEYDADSVWTATLSEVQQAGGAFQFGLIPNPTPTPQVP